MQPSDYITQWSAGLSTAEGQAYSMILGPMIVGAILGLFRVLFNPSDSSGD